MLPCITEIKFWAHTSILLRLHLLARGVICQPSAALLTALSYRLANKQGKLRAFSVAFVTLERGATITHLGSFQFYCCQLPRLFLLLKHHSKECQHVVQQCDYKKNKDRPQLLICPCELLAV